MLRHAYRFNNGFHVAQFIMSAAKKLYRRGQVGQAIAYSALLIPGLEVTEIRFTSKDGSATVFSSCEEFWEAYPKRSLFVDTFPNFFQWRIACENGTVIEGNRSLRYVLRCPYHLDYRDLANEIEYITCIDGDVGAYWVELKSSKKKA